MRIPPSGYDPVGALQAAAARLAAASAPVLAEIARTQPLINPETVTSPSADRWSSGWQAEAAAVLRYLSYTLPGDARAAITAAEKQVAANQAAAAKQAAAQQAAAASQATAGSAHH